MRVTKAVREYIEKQVRAKIEQKYEAEKNESKRIKDIKEDIETRAAEAARQRQSQFLWKPRIMKTFLTLTKNLHRISI